MINDDRATLATVTLTKPFGQRRTISATAELVHLAGNARPYFSATYEERNLRRRGDNQVESCGANGELIVEQFPELAPVVALHLADDDGVPMYAVANGAYFLGLGDPNYAPDDAPALDTFAKLWRVSRERAVELYDDARAAKPRGPRENERLAARRRLAELADAERPRWRAEAEAAAALIRQLGEG